MTYFLVATLLDTLNFAIVVLGVAIAFRVGRFPDLSGDGTFVLGAVVAAILPQWLGSEIPYVPIVAAAATGALAGGVTGLLASKVRVPPLLTGILMMLALYSVNIRVLGGPNRASNIERGSFWWTSEMAPVPRDLALSACVALGLLALIATAVLAGRSAVGLRLRAGCANPAASRQFGVNPHASRIQVLMIANGIIGLAGAVFVERSGFVDVRLGLGIVVSALAAILIGERLARHGSSLLRLALAVILGALIYKSIVAAALRAGLNPYDINLVTVGIIVIAFIAIPKAGSQLVGEDGLR